MATAIVPAPGSKVRAASLAARAGAALLTAIVSLAIVPPARAQLILSEIMADPVALPDARGEFVELANAGTAREAAGAAWLVVDGDSLSLGPVDLAAGAYLLACRDSSAMAALGVRCGRHLPGLSLANGRPLGVAVAWRDLRSDFAVPAAAAGRSWENTFDDEAGLSRFALSGRAFLEGDSATPGFRNSRSRRAPGRDMALGEASLLPGGVLEVAVLDRGAEPSGTGLRLRLDADWDGTAETPVESVAVAPGGGVARFVLGPDHLGILHLLLDDDEDPAGNAVRLTRLEDRTQEISEVCPAPEAGPEWAEIRNVTGGAAGRAGGSAGTGGGARGGYARALDLGSVAWDGTPLGPGAGRLGPGEYLLLTEDAAGLRGILGPLKARILEVAGWKALRNSGDTCRIALEGFGLDSLAYGGKDAAASPCLARSPAAPPGIAAGLRPAVPAGAATPGYAAAAPPGSPRLAVVPRILRPGGEFAIDVEVPPPAGFGLRVFDLEGNLLRVLAKGGAGRHAVSWSGADADGRPLPPGPYVLALGVAGRAPVRKVGVVADGQ